MGAIEKVLLSGSTNGRGVKIANTSTTVHTAIATHIDEIWLWAVNSSTSDVKLTVEFGGTTDPDDHIEFTVPAEGGLHLVVPGLLLQTAIVCGAKAGTTDVIIIYGYVNRHLKTEGL